MSRRKKRKKEEVMSVNVSKDKKEEKGFYLSLPVPQEMVIKTLMEKTSDTLVIDRYFQTIKEIGQTEANTLEKVAKIKYTFFWKILLIIAILVCLIVGMFLGVKISGSYDKFTLGATPTVQSGK